MQLLTNCCKSSHCSGYFTRASNTLECNVSQPVISQLTLFTKLTFVTEWLIKHYIWECAERHLKIVGNSSDANFECIINSLRKFMYNITQRRSLKTLYTASVYICHVICVHQSVLEVFTVEKWFSEIGRVDRRLQSVAIAMLILSQTVTNDIASTRVINLLSAILTQFDQTFANVELQITAKCMLNKAIRLMQLSDKTSAVHHTKSSVLLILSLIYLRRAMQAADNEEIHYLAHFYLGVFYYITGHYQSVLRYGKRLMTMHHSPHVIDGSCLPKISCDVDNVLGLSALYHYLQENVRFHSSHDSLPPRTVTCSQFNCLLVI
jgi:hypothetical protein